MAMQKAYRHEALTYWGQDEFVASCRAIAEDGLAAEHRVIFLVAAAKHGVLRAALDGSSDEVVLVAIDQLGRNPARITTILDTFQGTANGQHCVGVNESVYAGRSRAAFAEAQFAERVLNSISLHNWPLSLVCLYDESTLDAPALAEMRRSHPVLRGHESNDAYEPELAAATFEAPLDAPPDGVRWRDVRGDELASTRRYVRELARGEQLSGDRLEDLVFAANEIMTNSARHGGGNCRLAMWNDGESVVCEVRDDGVITDPMLGRLAPPLDEPHGRGLWLANQFCDLVQIRSAAHGTVVRLSVDHVS
jgi:anti-sigma regulatory factor (Ser/Thr protein kinase)